MNWRYIIVSGGTGAAILLVRLLVVALVREPARVLINRLWMIKLASSIWPFKDRVYSGDWQVVWTVQSSTFPPENRDVVELYKFLNFVAAEMTSTTNDSRDIVYVFVGEIRDKVVSGRWFDARDDKVGYFGSFQLVIAPTLDMAKGKWIGFSKDGQVKADELVLRKLS